MTDQSSKTRRAAIRAGLEQVLIRVTGDTDIINKPGIREITRQPDKYLSQYRYRLTTPPVSEESSTPTQPSLTPVRILVIDFQQQAIENQLANQKIAIWPASRPRVLIWLTQEGQGGREWVRFKTNPIAKQQLETVLNKRGLPSELPLLDLEDELNLPLGLAGGLISDVIQSASMRYQPDAVLAGRSYVSPNGEQQGNWLLIDGEKHLRFYTSSAAGNNQFESIIDQVANYFAAQYTRKTKNPDHPLKVGVDIHVLPLTGIGQYATFTRYLEGLSAVRDVYPILISEQYTVFHLNTDLSQDQFRSLIKLDKKLQTVTSGSPYDPAAPVLFEWTP
ncbi:MAG: DUF2066 domain-containing protein [Pseudomonadales bacterium]|nr:DUF2066 domain-containing protein [Pseudomonadales bacterium]